jgi:hypothetical protein
VKEADRPADVQLFAELYYLNMQRLQARDWYMFPESWLSDLCPLRNTSRYSLCAKGIAS